MTVLKAWSGVGDPADPETWNPTAVGAQGPPGPQGVEGPPGETGPSGAPGADAETIEILYADWLALTPAEKEGKVFIITDLGGAILSGTGAPGAGVGFDGDFYMDTSASVYEIYGPKTAGVWGTGTPLSSGITDADKGHITVTSGGTVWQINAGVVTAAMLSFDVATQAELDAAIATRQPLDADLTALAGAGNSTVLAATTASFLTADETKLDGIEAAADVTDATNVAAAGAHMVYVHNGSTYVLSTGRLFIGPEDPVADGFTMAAGDEWVSP